jgi:ribosomal protein L18E
LHSSHGDPFTLLNVFTEWLHVKAEGGAKSRAWCKRRGVEEQRLYEIVKIKEQFESTLKICTDGKDNEEATDKIKAKLDFQSEADHAEILRKRYTRRLIEKRKRESNVSSRKILKMTEEQDDSIPEDFVIDNVTGEQTVQELEFSLKNDAKRLVEQSDVSLLTLRDINVLKLIVAAGLYPNLAISDEANYARPITEHVYHSKAKRYYHLHSDKRFLSVQPTSVFAFNPKIIESKHLKGTFFFTK